MENPQPISSNEGFGKLKKERSWILEQAPLRKIPKPPKSFIEFCCLTRGLDDDERRTALQRFYRNSPEWKAEIGDYLKRLLEIRNHNIENCLVFNNKFSGRDDDFIPIKKIEVREADFKKHGTVRWMLIIGFEFWREEEKLKMRKIYIPLKWEV